MSEAKMDTPKEWAEALITGNPSKKEWKYLEHILIETAQYFRISDTPKSFEDFISNDEAPSLPSELGEQVKMTDFPVNPNDATLGNTDLVPSGVPENGFIALKKYYENGYVDRHLAEKWIEWCKEGFLQFRPE